VRVIGRRENWSEVELDPVKAYRRGRVLDAMLQRAIPAPKRGAYRGSFEFFAREDEARAIEAARRINTG
jgi:hypothetical protein